MFDKRISPIYRNKMEFVRDNIGKPKKVLDVGCGYGEHYTIFQTPGIKYHGIDIDKEALRNFKIGTYTNAENIPFESNKFDLAICIDVIEHTDNPDKVVKEINRVLRFGGRLIITVPHYFFPATYDPINAILRIFNKKIPIGMWAWGHKRLYTKDSFKKILEKNNFRIIKFSGGSHGFIAIFVNYLPYIGTYIIAPVLKHLGFRKFATFKTYKKTKTSPIYRIYTYLNYIDKKHFSNSTPITLYALVEKDRPPDSGKLYK